MAVGFHHDLWQPKTLAPAVAMALAEEASGMVSVPVEKDQKVYPHIVMVSVLTIRNIPDGVHALFRTEMAVVLLTMICGSFRH